MVLVVGVLVGVVFVDDLLELCVVWVVGLYWFCCYIELFGFDVDFDVWVGFEVVVLIW